MTRSKRDKSSGKKGESFHKKEQRQKAAGGILRRATPFTKGKGSDQTI